MPVASIFFSRRESEKFLSDPSEQDLFGIRVAWDPKEFSPISTSEIHHGGGRFKVRGKTFESFQEDEEYIYHINQFRKAYSGTKPRVVGSRRYIWYVFPGILLLVSFLLIEPSMVEYKFESYEVAENAGKIK